MAKKKKDDVAEGEEAKGGKKKLLMIGLVAVLAVGAGAYFFLFSGGSASAKAPTPGTAVALDPVAVNLAGGSYLKIGLTLQFTTGATKEELADTKGSKAVDLTISEFSGASLADVQTNREAMKAALLKKISTAYEGHVMELYYTEYVTQ
jgi:flagellar protein FliL